MTLVQYLWKSEFVPGRKNVGNILKQGEPCFQPSLTTCLFFILFLCHGVVLYAVPPCEGKARLSGGFIFFIGSVRVRLPVLGVDTKTGEDAFYFTWCSLNCKP